MKANIKTTIQKEIKHVFVSANVRYWEDSEVNGVEDTNGDLIPCRDGENWCPQIDIDSGLILNWKQGVSAEIHYKVCDGCSFIIMDNDGRPVYAQDNDYVPSFLSPKEDGYGDYIIMDITSEGYIRNWNGKKVVEFLEENQE